MAGWNGSGDFTFPYSWVADAAAGIDITASRMDTQFDTVSVDGFGNTLTRDGQGQPTANLPMAGFRHTGAAAGVDDNDYVIMDQITGGTSTLDVYSLTARHGISITAGGLIVTADGASVSGGLTVQTGGLVVTASGGTITAGGLHVTAGGGTITAGGFVVTAGGLTVTAGGFFVSDGAVQISPATGDVTLAPNARVFINPGTLGSMDRVTIGGTVAAAGTFTTLIANPGTTGSQVVNYSQFPGTLGTTGIITLPNGYVEQWGTGSTASGVGTIAFGASFATSCDNVQLTINGGSGAASLGPVFVGAISASGAAVYGSASESVGFFWRALGH